MLLSPSASPPRTQTPHSRDWIAGTPAGTGAAGRGHPLRTTPQPGLLTRVQELRGPSGVTFHPKELTTPHVGRKATDLSTTRDSERESYIIPNEGRRREIRMTRITTKEDKQKLEENPESQHAILANTDHTLKPQAREPRVKGRRHTSPLSGHYADPTDGVFWGFSFLATPASCRRSWTRDQTLTTTMTMPDP